MPPRHRSSAHHAFKIFPFQIGAAFIIINHNIELFFLRGMLEEADELCIIRVGKIGNDDGKCGSAPLFQSRSGKRGTVSELCGNRADLPFGLFADFRMVVHGAAYRRIAFPGSFCNVHDCNCHTAVPCSS